MNWRNTSDRYGALSMGLHWLTLVLMVGVYASMELSELFPRGSEARGALRQWHYVLGLAGWLLLWPRLLLRGWGRSPAITPPLAPWQKRIAGWVHMLLYAFMALMPLLLEENRRVAKLLKDVHEAGATLGYGLIGAHAAAALIHHHILKDNTLVRMLPLWMQCARKVPH